MMDLVDQAQDAELMHQKAALAIHTRRAQTLSGESLTRCSEPGCGVRIPQARRRAIAGVKYCVECQALIERRARQEAE